MGVNAYQTDPRGTLSKPRNHWTQALTFRIMVLQRKDFSPTPNLLIKQLGYGGAETISNNDGG
jgi:hypothetical protein